jgi:hypothetical protein
MKKTLVLVVLAVSVTLFTAGRSFAADATPVKLSLLPQICVPTAKVVHGLELGIIGAQSSEVQGVQLAWIYAKVDKKMVGLQSALVDIGSDVTGVQYGFYNGAKDVTGAQLGFINVTERLKGIQIGLVNIIKKGAPLPVMVFVNANF